MRNTVQWISILSLTFGAFACEQAPKQEEAAKPVVEAQKPAAKAEVAPASVKEVAPAAQDNAWTLTDTRRSAIEGALADAKGFLNASEQFSAAKATDSASALKALDSAKGKWLLVTGSVSKVSDTGIELSVNYNDSAAAVAPSAAAAPGAAAAVAAKDDKAGADKAGADKAEPAAAAPSAAASAQTLTIAVSKIEGFKKDSYQVDQKVALLVKYTGEGKAEAAHDVVALGHWAQADSAGGAALGAKGAAVEAAQGAEVAKPAAAPGAASDKGAAAPAKSDKY